MTHSAIDVLRRSRELIEEFGWIQGNYGSKEVGFCSAGAICECEGEGFPEPAVEDACDAFDDAVDGDGYYGTVSFNDAPGRTKEEVLKMFDQAIAHLHGKEDR